MALGSVGVSNLNQYQGKLADTERKFLFIGQGPADVVGELTGIDATTDIKKVFKGEESSELYKQLIVAQQNGGAGWYAMCYGLSTDEKWDEHLIKAQKTVSFEAVVVTDPITTKQGVLDAQVAMEVAQSKLARYQFVILTTEPLDPDSETWEVWIAKQTELVKDAAADRVMVVPATHMTNLGALAGRLARQDVTIADSPMRTATGVVSGLKEPLKGSDSDSMPDTIYQTLDAAKLSVPQTYPDYPGMYWADGNVLDVEGGDYQVIEHLRVMLKVQRQVRPLAVARIGNRQLNSSKNSIETHKTYFLRPLREMSKGISIGGASFPGEIEPPESDDIAIVWTSESEVMIYIIGTPYNSPKSISVGVALDLKAKE